MEKNVSLTDFNALFTRKVVPVSVLFGLTACVGFVANVLVVYIYAFKYKQCNFKYFLLVMGVIGLVQCTIMLPTQVGEMHYWFKFPTSWLCKVSAYVFGYTVVACYMVLLLIAIDRFRKVCRPYEWQIQSTTARNLCFIVSVASLFFAAPPGIVSGHHSYMTSYGGGNVTVTVCATDDMYKDRDWAIYFLLLFGGAPVSISIVVTCVLYAIILHQFWKGPVFPMKSLYNNKRTTSSSSESTQQSPRPVNRHEMVEAKCGPNNNIKTQDNQKNHKIKKVISFLQNKDTPKPTVQNGRVHKLKLSSSDLATGKKGVRSKLMRKTFIVLIITITCIVALVITFCLHLIAEDINHNILDLSTAQLNAFVIFHRGSFSIICAIFPVVYGSRDSKFREALFAIFGRQKSEQVVTIVAVQPPQTGTKTQESAV